MLRIFQGTLAFLFFCGAICSSRAGDSYEAREALEELDRYQIHQSPVRQKTFVAPTNSWSGGTELAMRRYQVPKSSLSVPKELLFGSYRDKNILLVGDGSGDTPEGMQDLGFSSVISTDLHAVKRGQYQADVLKLSEDLARYPRIPQRYDLVLGNSLLCCIAKEAAIQKAFISAVLVLRAQGRARFAQTPCIYSGTGVDSKGRYKFLRRLESALKTAQKDLESAHGIKTEIHLSTDFANGYYGVGLAEIVRLN